MPWINYRLHIGAAPQGAVGRVEVTGDILDLRETIYEKRKGRLGNGLAAEDLELYSPETDVQFADGTKQLVDEDLAALIDKKPHVIVVVRGCEDHMTSEMENFWRNWKEGKEVLGIKRRRETENTTEASGSQKRRLHAEADMKTNEKETMEAAKEEDTTKQNHKEKANKEETNMETTNEENTVETTKQDTFSPEEPGDTAETTLQEEAKAETFSPEEADDEETTMETDIEEETKVDLISPISDCDWYLGTHGRPLYVRQCVKDAANVILGRVLDGQYRKGGAHVFVISGASGIGKSWSINAFVKELLDHDLKVFLHRGEYGRAWLFSKNCPPKVYNPSQISAMRDPDMVYVYDSPGSKTNLGEHTQAKMRAVGVTLIFPSPKKHNYAFAVDKAETKEKVMNLPTWSKPEMLRAKPENSEAVNICYGLWGGNMRACAKFIQAYAESGAEAAKKDEVSKLTAQIALIDAPMAQKMSSKLTKQHVQEKFNSEALQDSPGHLLIPQPRVTDPNKSGCFEEFYWRFCSPLAERMFWDHMKDMDKDTVTKLLKSVFEVPSPKGVLFEKATHFLITNGLVRTFRCYSYTRPKEMEGHIQFPQCVVMTFETKSLQDTLRTALNKLKDFQPEHGKTKVAIALEPEATSFDAVDMFVLVKESGKGTEKDWSLYLLQDTIARKHSLHPVKVLWFCYLFCVAFQEVVLPTASKESILKRCNYVPVVPQEKKGDFAFDEPVSNSVWAEVKQVASLLKFTWPPGFPGNKTYLKALKEEKNLKIPPTTSGKERQLNNAVVGSALLLEVATAKVAEQCQVVFDVLNA